MKLRKQRFWLPALSAALLLLFFSGLYVWDNKYKTPPPYGGSGVMELSTGDFEDGRLLILTNGWLLSDQRITDRPTYIGEFASLQRGDLDVPPHGGATYRLTLRYHGQPIEAALSFPQLFWDYTLSLDARVLAQGTGGARCTFTLTQGDHLLEVQTLSRRGYYSGMYHPPMLGRSQAVWGASLLSGIAYAVAFFLPLALMLFTLSLWRSAGDQPALWFGLLCGCFSLYLSYYFVRLLHLPFGDWWFLIQSAALYGLCLCALRLVVLTGNMESSKAAGYSIRVLAASSGVLLLTALLIPLFPWLVRVNGILTDLYYITVFFCLLSLTLRSKPPEGAEGQLTLFACGVFGGGLLLNLFGSNLFEPILFFWQFEWCGIFLVALFGATMAARNKRILTENAALNGHLEELVEQRTAELTRLIQERKAFFADMAHDLKAPIRATRAFIQTIRENNTGVDGELLRYIDQVEQTQLEMARRVQSLTVFDRLEVINQPPEPVSVSQLLRDAYNTHHMAAEVAAVQLLILPPDTDGFVLARPEKLATMLENLIFNALRATAPGGTITLSAEVDQAECHLVIADTGSGISPDDLPHIFERFYVGKGNREVGSGIGLYLVKAIVEALNGEISVFSKAGQGTSFYIDLPLMKQSAYEYRRTDGAQ